MSTIITYGDSKICNLDNNDDINELITYLYSIKRENIDKKYLIINDSNKAGISTNLIESTTCFMLGYLLRKNRI